MPLEPDRAVTSLVTGSWRGLSALDGAHDGTHGPRNLASGCPVSTVIHIGLPKTGTTALQTHFFPRLPGCTFVSAWGEHSDPVFRLLSQDLLLADDERYLADTL